MFDDVTFVLTSCGRFDLLKATLDSFFAAETDRMARYLIIEDSGDERVREVVAGYPVPIEVIVNGTQLGQFRSIDRAYETVTTPYVFHCEDDWTFTRSGVVGRSRTLMERFADVSTVGLRVDEEVMPRLLAAPVEWEAGVAFRRIDPAVHPEWFGFSFNPGLKRIGDWRRLGPFAPIGREDFISVAYKKAGMRMLQMVDGGVAHLGRDRHVHDPYQPRRERSPLGKLRRSLRRRFERLRRRFADC